MVKHDQPRVFVVGVGMTKFLKPSQKEIGWPTLGKTAVERALADAGMENLREEVQFAATGSMLSMGASQRVLYDCGIFDIPMSNVNNACATGSNALYLARQSILAGGDCALALGLEKMKPGSLGGGKKDGATSLDNHFAIMKAKYGIEKAPPMAQFFANAGREHMAMYGTKAEHFAMIGEKNHRHSINNPYSQFRDQYSLSDVLESTMVMSPITKLQCSPTSDGAACAIVCSEDFVIKHGLQGQAVEIIGQSMRSDAASAFAPENTTKTLMELVGFGMAQRAANEVYAMAGITADQVDVVELHDCFSCNELLMYEALGLCKEGEGGKFIESGSATFGGKTVVQPSGGLISKGHPLGATGLAQCCELSWQMRNECGPRQVKGARIGLQHNLGLGGAVVVTAYQRPSDAGWAAVPPKRKQSLAMGPAPTAKL